MANMKKHRRDISRMVKMLTTDFETSITRAGHIRVTVRGPLGERSITTSATPSDGRSMKNFRADLVRAVLSITPADPDLIKEKK